MRAIDTAKLGTAGRCTGWEGAVDLATPQYVQNVATSTVNQTTIMGRATFPALSGPDRVIQWTCGGWVATNPTVSIDPPTFSGASGAPLTVHAMTNVEMQNSGFPGTTEWIWFNLASTQNVHTQITCVDPRVYGETYPVAARAQPTVTTSNS